MSTYLLAFIVGEYDFIEEKDSNGVLVRVYTPVGKKEQGRFALNVTKSFEIILLNCLHRLQQRQFHSILNILGFLIHFQRLILLQ